MTADGKRPVISLFAEPKTSPGVLYGLYDVLSSAGAAYREMTTGEEVEGLLNVQIVAASCAPFRCAGDVMIEPHSSIDDVHQSDAVIVCDIYNPIDLRPHARHAREVDWFERMYANEAVLASVCTGSLLLAETGLLDGLEVTGHWAYWHLCREHYPNVRWREDSILCLAGEQERVVTAGGGTAWHDLALYLIARFCGSEHAINTARVHLLLSHTDGQLPFAAMTQRVQHTDAVIRDCQHWIAEHYAVAKPVSQMAEHSGLKPRTFARRFRKATGYLPLEYVQTLRIERAKHLLETERTNLEEIGYRVGYEDTAFFRRLFRRETSLTPANYRKKFADIGRVAPSLRIGRAQS